MRIAMLGTRGVPASYSGFETCVESVGKRLVSRGHRVQVYCRSGVSQGLSSYLGMDLITLPAIHTKGLETLTHSAASTLHARLAGHPQAVIIFGVGNAVFARALQQAGIPVAINVDGADWARQKWGGIGRRYLRWSEREATRSAGAVVADSHSVAAYYEREYRARCSFIPYGADIPATNGLDTLERFGLTPRGYFLAVGRFVPENGFHHLIEAYRRADTQLPFVVVGDAPYSDAYKEELRKMAPPAVIFTGYQFGAAYHELSANAFAFLFGAEVGGTESNAEVMDDAGMLFKDLEVEMPPAIKSLIAHPQITERLREQARRRAAAYSWDRVTDAYEALLEHLVVEGRQA